MPTLTKEFVQNSCWKPDLFKNKVVFITGGAGTICKVQAEALVLLGANAAIIGRNELKTVEAAKDIQSLRDDSKVIGIGNIDVREVDSLKKAVDITIEQLGRIDFVIAGAAGNFLSDFNHMSSNAFKSVISIDLLGSFNTVKACFNELKRTKGSILFVSATLHYYGIAMQSHVGSAKAGIDALSNALAVELGPLGIRSNCIAPGYIEGTEGLSRLKPPGGVPMSSRVPLQRLGTTEDIAQSTVYIFSPASSYVTGTVQIVDGAAWHIGGFTSPMYPKIVSGNEKFNSRL